MNSILCLGYLRGYPRKREAIILAGVKMGLLFLRDVLERYSEITKMAWQNEQPKVHT